MPKDKRNSLHIYYKQKGKEIHKTVYPKEILGRKVDWREFNYPMAYDLYNQGWTEVCKYFNVLVPDDLDTNVKWCWDALPTSLPWQWEEKEKIFQTDQWKTYEQMQVESNCASYVDSMFNEAYKTLYKAACDLEEQFNDTTLKVKDRYKCSAMLSYLFNEGIHCREAIADGGLIFRDGSYLAIDFGFHCTFIEAFCGLKEYDMERYWVKISRGYVYTHDRMSVDQWNTLAELTSEYSLCERKIGEW